MSLSSKRAGSPSNENFYALKETKYKGMSDKDKILAIRKGQIHLVKKYIIPTNVQYKFDGGSALHCACVYDQIDIVKYLLEIGADPTATDNWWRRPIELTRSETIRSLLRSYMDGERVPQHSERERSPTPTSNNSSRSSTPIKLEPQTSPGSLRRTPPPVAKHHSNNDSSFSPQQQQQQKFNNNNYSGLNNSNSSNLLNTSISIATIEQEEILRLRKLLQSKDQEIDLLKNNMRDAERMIQNLNQEILRVKKKKEDDGQLIQQKVSELYSLVVRKQQHHHQV